MDELDAMKSAHETLSGLDEDAKKRVIIWLADKFGVNVVPKSTETNHEEASAQANTTSYSTFAEFLSVTQATSDADRALVAAYWLQEVLSEDSVDTQSANTLLKDAGYSISNVTRAFDRLKAMRPCPVVQIRKTGSTKQARKLYKVSAHGIGLIKKMEHGDV